MNKRAKSKLRKKVFAEIRKKLDITDVANNIINLFDAYTIEKDNYQHELELKIRKLNKVISDESLE